MSPRTPATNAQLARLRDALLGIDQLHSPECRNMYVAAWERRFRASVPRFSDARHDLTSLLRTADDVDGGLAGWAEIVADGQGRTDPVARFLAVCADATPADITPADITLPPASPTRVFVSYAHDDDDVTYGRITKLVGDLDAAYRNRAGGPSGVFLDHVTIRLGEDWRAAVAAGLSSSVVLLAFVSPAFLRSKACRREVADFVAGDGGRTILPLVFFDRKVMRTEFAADPVWQRLDRLQTLPIVDLRSADPGSQQWLEVRDRIALRLAELLEPHD